jgi:hypothetical protein
MGLVGAGSGSVNGNGLVKMEQAPHMGGQISQLVGWGEGLSGP